MVNQFKPGQFVKCSWAADGPVMWVRNVTDVPGEPDSVLCCWFTRDHWYQFLEFPATDLVAVQTPPLPASP